MRPSPTRQFLIGPGALDCNRGDQALLWQAIDCLRGIDPTCRIAILSEGFDDPNDVQSRQTRDLGVDVLPPFLFNPRRSLKARNGPFIDSVASVLRMAATAVWDFAYSVLLWTVFNRPRWALRLLDGPRRRTYEYLRACDGLVIKGGGYLYAYKGIKWAYYLWFGLVPLMLAQRCGIRVLVLPNSFGPFDTAWSRFLARRVLGRCDLLTCREPRSGQVLNAIVPDKARLFPDMAFGLHAHDAGWARAELTIRGVPATRTVGITLRPWRFPTSADPQAKYAAYIEAHAAFIVYLVEHGFSPVLFAHVVGPHAHEDDRIALRAVLERVPCRERIAVLEGDYTCRHLKALYGHMEAMICTRFHSAIFSIAQHVPCIAVSYQGFKALGIMDQVALAPYTIPIDCVTADGLIRAFVQMQADRQAIRARMAAFMAECLPQLTELNRAVAQVIFAPRIR